MSLQAEPPSFKLQLRGGKVEIRLAHNQKIAGATPASATNMAPASAVTTATGSLGFFFVLALYSVLLI